MINTIINILNFSFFIQTLKPSSDDEILRVLFDDAMLIPGGDYIAKFDAISFKQRNAKSFEVPFTMSKFVLLAQYILVF